MPKLLTVALPWLIVATLAVLLVRGCAETTPAIPKELQADLDRYKADSARVRAERDSALADAAEARQRADSAEAVARRARTRASVLEGLARETGRLADSAAAAGEWQAAYVARTAERDTLLTVVATQANALASLDTALTAERARGLTLAEAERRAQAQIVRVEDLNRRLIDAANNAGKCRIARVVPCPSRTTSALFGLAAGAGVVIAAN